MERLDEGPPQRPANGKVEVQNIGVARQERVQIGGRIGEAGRRYFEHSRFGDPGAGRGEQRDAVPQCREPADQRHHHALRATVPRHGQQVVRCHRDVQRGHAGTEGVDLPEGNPPVSIR